MDGQSYIEAGNSATPCEAMHFEKYEGLGNDFIVAEVRDAAEVPPPRAAELCDRRLGVGADGVILVLPPRTPEAIARMRVINADGSVPEMCGNGIRCMALHLARREGKAAGSVLSIETDAGPRLCKVDGASPASPGRGPNRGDADGEGMVTVSMGAARVLGERQLLLDGIPDGVTLTTADVGNPHAVLLGTFTREDVERLGPALATHPSFPQGTNVEFARVGEGRIDLVVWERGVGITLACGTGACATAAVACVKGLAKLGTPIDVHLPGGRLEITISNDGTATMRGPARRVFGGEV
jgi:diaminopimelate epimerase